MGAPVAIVLRLSGEKRAFRRRGRSGASTGSGKTIYWQYLH